MNNKLGRLVLAAALFAFFGGCGSPQHITNSLDMPGATLSVVAAPQIKDGRARFRELFCKVLSADAEFGDETGRCEEFLWKLRDEPPPGHCPRGYPSHDTRYKILFASGLFGECTWRTRRPFENATERLRELGYETEWLAINGLSSSDHNADRIARQITNLNLSDDNSLILIGHSKGAVDNLHFLVKYPHLARQVTALISVSGAVNGSPLADSFQNVGQKLLKSVPSWVCPPGDDRALRSLQRSVRMNWLAANRLPEFVHYFSLVGYTYRDNVSAGLVTTYDRLRAIDPRNDGLLLFYDQVIPGAALLGYANADHWAVAMPADSKSSPFLKGLMNKNRYPRASLIEAAVLYAIESIAAKNEGS